MIVTPEVATEVEALLVEDEPRYLAILAPKGSSAEQVNRYLYGPGFLYPIAECNNMVGFVAILTKHYAQATADRLGSGLYGASVHDSLSEATERLAELMF